MTKTLRGGDRWRCEQSHLSVGRNKDAPVLRPCSALRGKASQHIVLWSCHSCPPAYPEYKFPPPFFFFFEDDLHWKNKNPAIWFSSSLFSRVAIPNLLFVKWRLKGETPLSDYSPRGTFRDLEEVKWNQTILFKLAIVVWERVCKIYRFISFLPEQ